jgi:hypothetical protein
VTMKKSIAKNHEKAAITPEKSPAASRRPAVAEGAHVAMDARSGHDRRNRTERREKSIPVAIERRQEQRRVKVNRRRQIDPTTCERDYSSDEIEFMNAMDEYKRSSGRMFPTCSEILEVVRDLGYGKRPVVAEAAVLPGLPSFPTPTEQAV